MLAAKWLEKYSGQTAEELLALEGEYRVDSLVVAFEQALDQKSARTGVESLSEAEQTVLAVEALEREVNNGGYSQFFVNSSREYATTIVESLQRIGCPATATFTQKALAAFHLDSISEEGIARALALDDEGREEEFDRCDDLYYHAGEDIAERLFAFLKANKSAIRL
jgi:hypothetical protein